MITFKFFIHLFKGWLCLHSLQHGYLDYVNLILIVFSNFTLKIVSLGLSLNYLQEKYVYPIFKYQNEETFT